MTLVQKELKNAYIWIPNPTSIVLNKSAISLTTVGQTEQLTATIEPTVSDKTITWSSDDTSIATVSTTGLVTCVTPWTCTITATTMNGLTASCSVAMSSNYRYIKWSISNNRANNPSTTSVQMSEFKLYDGSNELSRPVWTSCSCNQSYVSSEWPAKLIDGSVYTKFNTWASFTPPCELVIDVGSWNEIDFSIYNKYRWYTANDADARDPITWEVYLSNDNLSWVSVSSVNNATITTNRYALAGTWDITI